MRKLLALTLCFSSVGCTWIKSNLSRSVLTSDQGDDPFAPQFKAVGPWYVLSTGSIEIDVNHTASGSVTGIAEDPSNDAMTITAVGTPSFGNVVNSGNKIVYTPTSSTSTGRDQFSVTITNSKGKSRTSNILLHVVSPFTWTGGVSNTWDSSTGGNWCGGINANKSACTNSGTVPGVGDIAVIDDTCVSANCSPTFNYNVSVAGLRLAGSTLNQQTGRTLTVGTSSYIQTGGVFNGGDSNVIMSGDVSITGGTFRSTSGLLQFTGSNVAIQITIGSSFIHSNGTVRFYPGVHQNMSVTANIPLYRLHLGSAGPNETNFTTSDMTVQDTVTLRTDGCGGGAGKMYNGTFRIRGDVVADGSCSPVEKYGSEPPLFVMDGSGPQALDFSGGSGAIPSLEIAKTGGSTLTLLGSMRFFGHITHTSGVFNSGTSSVRWEYIPVSVSYSASSLQFYNLAIGSWGNPTPIDLLGNTLVVNNNLEITNTGCGGSSGMINNGTIRVGGNITTTNCGSKGSAQVVAVGATPTLSVNAIHEFPLGGLVVGGASPTTLSLAASSTIASTAPVSVVNGSINMAGFNFTINQSLTLSPGTTVSRGGAGTLTIGGSPIPNGAYSGGSIVP